MPGRNMNIRIIGIIKYTRRCYIFHPPKTSAVDDEAAESSGNTDPEQAQHSSLAMSY